MEMIWSPIIKTKLDRFYGMGWGVMPAKKEIAFGDENRYHVFHSGMYSCLLFETNCFSFYFGAFQSIGLFV